MALRCFYHPKVDSTATCRRCMITLCEDCTHERYCPDCHKMALYVRSGHSGRRPGNLVVEDNQRRASLTRQLMINRLANSVLAEMPPSGPARRPAGQRKRAAKSAGAFNTLAGTAAAVVVAFSLGTLYSRPPAQAAHRTEPVAVPVEGVASQALEASEPAGTAEVAPAARERHVTYSYAPVSGFRTSPVAPTAPAHRPVHAAGRVMPASMPAAGLVPDLPAAPSAAAPLVPDLPVPAARDLARPALAVAWPYSGNTLRLTSYVKVNVTNPGQISVLNVTVDGKPLAPVRTVLARTEIPVDTTQLSNGDHRLQVLAMTEAGDLITSDAVPVTVVN